MKKLIRVYAKGGSPTSDPITDMEADCVPAVGDQIWIEGERGERVATYRVTGRIFRASTVNDKADIAVEAVEENEFDISALVR